MLFRSRKYNYQGVVFFDTFPIREAADQETQANIDAFEKYLSIVDELGVEKIDEVVAKRDGISAQKLILGMLRS